MKARWWIVGLFGVSWVVARLIANDPVQPSAQIQTPSSRTTLSNSSDPPQPRPTQAPQKPRSTTAENIETRYVSGHRVALRSSPSKNGAILDRLDLGRKVTLLGQENGWSHVRDDLTQRDGWLSSRLLNNEPPKEKREPDKPKPSEPKKVDPPNLPTLTDATIIARIISESISGYPGNCPCPYNRDRAGHKCGGRSAYSRPGGYSPVCYPTDVTRAMIDAFRNAP